MSTQFVLSRKSSLLKAESCQTLWNNVLEIILEWQRRAQSRRELARLSLLDVKDLNYRPDIASEKRKPF
jgi:uncharacterized protein YjiS (DUF1127 family)